MLDIVDTTPSDGIFDVETIVKALLGGNDRSVDAEGAETSKEKI